MQKKLLHVNYQWVNYYYHIISRYYIVMCEIFQWLTLLDFRWCTVFILLWILYELDRVPQEKYWSVMQWKLRWEENKWDQWEADFDHLINQLPHLFITQLLLINKYLTVLVTPTNPIKKSLREINSPIFCLLHHHLLQLNLLVDMSLFGWCWSPPW